jgi:predicted ATPase/class 3 adenylate cyclase
MNDRPRGTVTFLFTDIEGSTRVLSAVGPERYGELLGLHQELIRTAIGVHGGHEIDTQGDAFFVAFERPGDAVGAAIAAQRALADQPWPERGEIRVRMAIHTAEATTTSHGYVGVGVHRAARICAVGQGGQVLVSQATHDLLLDDAVGHRLLDLGEHRLKDFSEPQRLFQLMADGLATDFPPLRSGISTTNLPAELTSFVGREREAAGIRALLDGHRLVSLVGVGGTGKTRLMLHVAGEATSRHTDGAWLIELAPLREPALVIEEVVRSLAVQVGPGQPAIAALTDFLRDKDLLLLLDNCEHLIDAAAELVERLMGTCPSLRVLTTSREALGVAGEATYAVPSLGLPAAPDGIELDLDAIAATESVALFVERATATLPSFRLDATTARPVVEICRRLDGIPLALELAAARVNVLSPDEIARGLGDRFSLLTGGRRTAVPRQQTLQALIDWSWDLLGETDQRLLRRLSVFAGGWTLDAAAAVTGDQDDPGVSPAAGVSPSAAARVHTLDGLGRLADRSLIVVAHAGETRYGMLETIRQYASDRVVVSGEAGELRARHLAWFRRLVLEAAPGLDGSDMVAWLGRLDAELDNLRGALDWAHESDPETALEMSVALSRYWRSRTMGREGVDRLRHALELARRWRASPSSRPEAERALLEARVVVGLENSLSFTGWQSDVSLADEAVAAARASGDDSLLVDAIVMALQAEMIMRGGPRTDAQRAAAHEALDAATRLDDPSRLSIAQQAIAMLEAPTDPVGADRWLEMATESARRSGSPWAIATTFQMRGRVAAYVDRPLDAQRFFREAQSRFEEAGDARFALSAPSEHAHALRRAGALVEADDEYRRTIRGWQRTGNRGAVANQLESLAFVAVATSAGDRAARLLGAAEALREQSGDAMTSPERVEYEAEVDRLRGLLGPEALGAAWAEGRRLSAEEAVALAVSGDPPVTRLE